MTKYRLANQTMYMARSLWLAHPGCKCVHTQFFCSLVLRCAKDKNNFPVCIKKTSSPVASPFGELMRFFEVRLHLGLNRRQPPFGNEVFMPGIEPATTARFLR